MNMQQHPAAEARNTKNSWMKRLFKGSLTTWIFLSLVLGVVAGLVFGEHMVGLRIIGDLWLRLIKLIIVPLVLVIMVQAIAGNGKESGAGRIAAVSVSYFMITTVIASAIGCIVALVFQPGKGFDLNSATVDGSQDLETPEVTVKSFISGFFSDNMFASFSEGDMLHVLLISVLLGVAVKLIPSENTRVKLAQGVHTLSEWIFAYLRMVIVISPIGVFFLMAATVGDDGGGVLRASAELIGVFYIGVLAQIFVVYGAVVWMSAGMNPIRFLINSSRLWLFGIGSASSVAAIPVHLRVAEENFSVRRRVREFVAPLGSQINSDGNALLLPSVIVFTALATGMDLTFGFLLQAVLLGTLVSFAGGGIPGGGIVRILIALQFFGLPLEVGAIIAGFYRLLDMGTTGCNVLGDLSGSIVTNRLVGPSTDEKTDARVDDAQ